jgi:hypothetical protein
MLREARFPSRTNPPIWFTPPKRLAGIFSAFPFRGRLRSCQKTSSVSPQFFYSTRTTFRFKLAAEMDSHAHSTLRIKIYFITGFASSCILALGDGYPPFSDMLPVSLSRNAKALMKGPDCARSLNLILSGSGINASVHCLVHVEFDILRWITRPAYQTSATWSHVFDVERKATHQIPRHFSKQWRWIDMASVLWFTNSRIRSLNPIYFWQSYGILFRWMYPSS